MEIYFGIVVFLFGLTVGSFLNVLLYRLPKGLGVAKGFSFCPRCNHRLMPKDLVPLFSYLFLGGKCRYCKAKISPQYPFVESLNAVLWVLCYVKLGLNPLSVCYMLMFSCFVVLMFTDWQERIIPDQINIAIFAFALAIAFLDSSLSLKSRLIGALCISVPMVVLGFFGAMGGGDIKLMVGAGLALGWKLALLTTVLGSCLGSAVYLALKNSKHSPGRYIPFGTFLAIAGIFSVFFGNTLIEWYLGLMR